MPTFSPTSLAEFKIGSGSDLRRERDCEFYLLISLSLSLSLSLSPSLLGIIDTLEKHMSPDWKPTEVEGANVIELTDKTFESVIKREKLIMVQFYAPW